jgi:hypothetical protein
MQPCGKANCVVNSRAAVHHAVWAGKQKTSLPRSVTQRQEATPLCVDSTSPKQIRYIELANGISISLSVASGGSPVPVLVVCSCAAACHHAASRTIAKVISLKHYTKHVKLPRQRLRCWLLTHSSKNGGRRRAIDCPMDSVLRRARGVSGCWIRSYVWFDAWLAVSRRNGPGGKSLS